jgi:hypothetical protein
MLQNNLMSYSSCYCLDRKKGPQNNFGQKKKGLQWLSCHRGIFEGEVSLHRSSLYYSNNLINYCRGKAY